MTDYAILLMVELTREGETLSAHALADRIHVEVPTASKVLKLLAGADLLQSYRGASGGYRVNRPAEQVSVAEIIAAIEGPIAMTECSVEAGLCSQEDQLQFAQQLATHQRGGCTRIAKRQPGRDVCAAETVSGRAAYCQLEFLLMETGVNSKEGVAAESSVARFVKKNTGTGLSRTSNLKPFHRV